MLGTVGSIVRQVQANNLRGGPLAVSWASIGYRRSERTEYFPTHELLCLPVGAWFLLHPPFCCSYLFPRITGSRGHA